MIFIGYLIIRKIISLKSLNSYRITSWTFKNHVKIITFTIFQCLELYLVK